MTNISQNPSQFCTAFVSNFKFENGNEITTPKTYNHKFSKIFKHTKYNNPRKIYTKLSYCVCTTNNEFIKQFLFKY